MDHSGLVIDTSVFIEFLRAKNKTKTDFYNLTINKNICISSITLFELYMGATTPDKELDIQILIQDLSILPVSNEVALMAAKIYKQLRKRNKLIEFRDILIAATCIINNMAIVSKNKKHFSRIDGLIVF